MINQYPHILKFELNSGSTEEIDENGDTIIVPGATTTIEIKCRFEPNGSGQYLTSNDGSRLDFGWMIYMPVNGTELSDGINITGFNDGILIASGTVKRFSQGQLNARAWV